MATITDHLPDTRKLRKRARREADQLRARAAKEARVLGRRAGAAMEELREATAARAAEIREDLRTLPSTPLVADARDVAAARVGTGASSAGSELAAVRRRLAGIERGIVDAVRDLLDDQTAAISGEVDRAIAAHDEHLQAVLTRRRGTSWPRRLLVLALGMAAGAAVAYLTDPDRGSDRRDAIVDQLSGRGEDLPVAEARLAVEPAADDHRVGEPVDVDTGLRI